MISYRKDVLYRRTHAVAHAQDIFLLLLEGGLGFPFAVTAICDGEVEGSGKEDSPNADAQQRRMDLGSRYRRVDVRRYTGQENLYSLESNPCSENRMPPAKKHMPRTSTMTSAAFSCCSFGRDNPLLQSLLSIPPTTARTQMLGTVLGETLAGETHMKTALRVARICEER